jgi:hypothetical protein
MNTPILNVETSFISDSWFSNTTAFQNYTQTTPVYTKTISQELVWNGTKIIPTTYFHKVVHKSENLVRFKSYVEEDRQHKIPKKFRKAVEYLTFSGTLPWEVIKCIARSQLTEPNTPQNLLAFIFPGKILITQDTYSTSNAAETLEEYVNYTAPSFEEASKKSMALLLKSDAKLSAHQKVNDRVTDTYVMTFLQEFLKTMFDDDLAFHKIRMPNSVEEMSALGPKKAP